MSAFCLGNTTLLGRKRQLAVVSNEHVLVRDGRWWPVRKLNF